MVEVVEIGGRPRDIDACLEPFVRALNDGGFPTRNSCCGHGRMPPSVILNDDRFIVILTREQFFRWIPQRWIHAASPPRYRCTDCGGAPGDHSDECTKGDLAIVVPSALSTTRRETGEE